jgi:hypothetical protein
MNWVRDPEDRRMYLGPFLCKGCHISTGADKRAMTRSQSENDISRVGTTAADSKLSFGVKSGNMSQSQDDLAMPNGLIPKALISKALVTKADRKQDIQRSRPVAKPAVASKPVATASGTEASSSKAAVKPMHHRVADIKLTGKKMTLANKIKGKSNKKTALKASVKNQAFDPKQTAGQSNSVALKCGADSGKDGMALRVCVTDEASAPGYTLHTAEAGSSNALHTIGLAWFSRYPNVVSNAVTNDVAVTEEKGVDKRTSGDDADEVEY